MADETDEKEFARGHINCGGVKLNLDKLTFSLSCIYCDFEMVNIKEFCYHFQEHLVMSKAENELLLKNVEENMQKSVCSTLGNEARQSLSPVDTKPRRESLEKQSDYEIEVLEDYADENQIESITTNIETNGQENHFVYEDFSSEFDANEQKPHAFELKAEIAEQPLAEQTQSEIEEADEEEEEAVTMDIGFSLLPNDEDAVTKCKFYCEICNFTFSDAATLRKHRQHHHICKICGINFTSKAQLKMHLRTHGKKTIYNCRDCDQSFGTLDECHSHRRYAHQQKNLNLCNTCGKSFQDENLLRQHIEVHTTARPFVCLECNMTFSKSSALMLHTKLHTDVRKFSCSICRMTFAQNSGLLAHSKERHS